MKSLLLLLAASAALAAPGLARATETPNPAAAACYAQYQQLGAAGFAAKYGTGEAAVKACLQANGGTTTAKTKPVETSNPAAAACYAQYRQLGATAFAARYGTGEAGTKACLQANGGTTTAKPLTDDVTRTVVAYICSHESSEAGKRACLQTKLAQAQGLIARCRSTAGTAKGAFELCIKQALGAAAKTGANAETATRAAACAAEVKALGYDAFQQKYGRGKDGVAACLRTKR
jgi:hypothetical protein